MAGRYETEREWDWRSEDRDRGPRGDRWAGREDRSFRPDDRVFGERESGMGYNQSRDEWQAQRRAGQTPAMRPGGYDAGYRATPHGQRLEDIRGARFYTDDERGPGYARPEGSEWSDGRRFGPREADARHGPAPRPLNEARETFEDRARDAGGLFRRAGERIAGWFGEVADENHLNPERSARGLGPKGYRRSDERISEDVHQHLTDDHWLDASDVNVAVSDGEVTLSGVVESREARRLAERIIEDLSGVRHVQNNLRIRNAGSYTPAGSGSGSVGDGGYGAGASGGNLREEGDAANTTSANARNKT